MHAKSIEIFCTCPLKYKSNKSYYGSAIFYFSNPKIIFIPEEISHDN